MLRVQGRRHRIHARNVARRPNEAPDDRVVADVKDDGNDRGRPGWLLVPKWCCRLLLSHYHSHLPPNQIAPRWLADSAGAALPQKAEDRYAFQMAPGLRFIFFTTEYGGLLSATRVA